MAQTPTQQYTARTYGTVMEALIVHLKSRFTDGHWETLLSQDVPLAMLSALAWMHEQDGFYMNRRWRNTYLELADDREPTIYLCKQLGYRMRPRTAASVAVRLYPQPKKSVQIVIPAGTTIPFQDTYFEFLENATIPANSDYWPDEAETEVIALTEGESKDYTVESDGQPWQKYTIPFENVIEGSLVVEVAGEEWEEVSSLIYVEGDTLGRDVFSGTGIDGQTVTLSLLSAIIDPDNADHLTVLVDGTEWSYVSVFTSTPNQFTAYQDGDGNTTITFGNSADGSAPASGSVIDVLYLVSGAQKRYSLTYDQNDQPTIKFGDDNTGVIPPIGAEIRVSCRVGGGVVGNIDLGEIDEVVTGYLNELPGVGPSGAPTEGGETTEVRVYNYSKGSGGNPRESIDRAKQLAPAYAIANQRAVTQQDWEVLAATYYDPRYGAPAHAAAKLHQDVPESNQVDVALWSRDSEGRLTVSGESLKAAVRNFLSAKRTMCTYVEMIDGITYYFDVYLAVSLKRGFFTTTVFSNLQQAVIDFFNSAQVLPGKDIRINKLYDALNEVEGVYSVTIENIVGTVLLTDSQTADGSSQTYSWLFENPLGQEIVPGSFITRAGEQSIWDDGQGNMTGDIDASFAGIDHIDYTTGRVSASFETPPVIGTNITAEVRYYAKLEWEEDKSAEYSGLGALDDVTEFAPIVPRPPIGMVDGSIQLDFYLPDYLMPVVPGRFFFIGGYNPNNITTPGWGEQKTAYDDSEGNIVGDVDPAGVNTIDYRTGRVRLKWDTSLQLVFPGLGMVNLTGQLNENADGVRKDFTFFVQGWTVSPLLNYGPGLYKLDFTSYPGWGAEAVLYENSFGQIFGLYLDNRGDSTWNNVTGTGTLHFSTPPASPGAPPHTFPFLVRDVTLVLYSGWVFYVKTPLIPGHDLYWFADHTGKIWGTTPDAYPTTRLSHKTGQFVGRLSSGISSGRTVKLLYDAFLQSKSRNIPIHAAAIGTFGQTILRELEEEIDL